MYNKEPTGRRPGFLQPIAKFDAPLHTLHIDHTSIRNNAYLLVAVDGFTKFVFLKAVGTNKVGPVLKFLDEVFKVFGVTQRVM
jgi:hypothetical protein